METLTLDSKTAQPSNPRFLVFNKENQEIGCLDFKDGKLTFTGDADESAKIFFDSVIKRTIDYQR